jgi:crotonobetainyl-CoA:carnitine CoA-transferase CaiB-like acyl-CoA transferase
MSIYNIMKTLFSNLTIIDISTVLAGPSVGMFFAELGARVIKIEHPIHKDITRSWKLPSEEENSEISAYFSSVNYGKTYQFIDLKNSEERELLYELCATADIVLMNFKRGDQEKLAITDQHLRQNNKRLIIGKISGFGDNSDRVAYDLILQAESGIMSMNGTKDTGPLKMPLALIDVLAAHHLKEGLLIALLELHKNKIGKTVTVSLYDAAVSSLINQASNYLMAGRIAQPIGSLHPTIAPYGELFKTKDNITITFAIGSNRHFELLCNELGLSELSFDIAYASVQSRVVNRAALTDILSKKIECRSSDELLEKMHHLNVPVARINSIAEVLNQPSAQKRVLNEVIEGVQTKRVESIAFKII